MESALHESDRAVAEVAQDDGGGLDLADVADGLAGVERHRADMPDGIGGGAWEERRGIGTGWPPNIISPTTSMLRERAASMQERRTR